MALLIFYVVTAAESSASLASRSMGPQRTPRSFRAVYRVRPVIFPGRRRCGSRYNILLIYVPLWPPATPRLTYLELPHQHTSTDSSSRHHPPTPASLVRYTLAWVPNRSSPSRKPSWLMRCRQSCTVHMRILRAADYSSYMCVRSLKYQCRTQGCSFSCTAPPYIPSHGELFPFISHHLWGVRDRH